ncbi:hypothetical protein RJT34_29350 [Clitoria ternatea]|uniref:Uncharacterized protein n=1 Tax=Clitoria ternatea TaxID=43366 RepID=A0AAN9FC26_CLITE
MLFQNREGMVDWVFEGLGRQMQLCMVSNLDLVVHQLWSDGNWSFDLLMTPFNEEIKKKVVDYSIPRDLKGEDLVVWNKSVDGVFFAKGGYSWLTEEGLEMESKVWSMNGSSY